MIVELKEEDCRCSIVELYDRVAEKSGKSAGKSQYDCRKVRCTEEIFNQVKKYYEEDEGCQCAEFGMLWLCCGPKANLDRKGFFMEVEDEFFVC